MSAWYRTHRHLYPDDWDAIAQAIKDAAGWHCGACRTPHGGPPFVLTVHHLDSTPAHCASGNLIALCQRCHLRAHGLRPSMPDRAALIVRLRTVYELELSQLCLPLTMRV